MTNATDKLATAIPYNRSALIESLRSVNNSSRLGTAQLRSMFAQYDNDWAKIEVEITRTFYELGYSDEHRDLFNGSFRSMVRNALKSVGSAALKKTSYKRTRTYTDGDRELTADDNGSWYWHVEVNIQVVVKSDEERSEVQESHEVVGEPVELTDTEKVLNKVLNTNNVDRVEATVTLLNSLTDPAAAFVIRTYLEQSGLTSIREIRQKAEIHEVENMPTTDAVDDDSLTDEQAKAVA